MPSDFTRLPHGGLPLVTRVEHQEGEQAAPDLHRPPSVHWVSVHVNGARKSNAGFTSLGTS
jgi:hypothetical protein